MFLAISADERFSAILAISVVIVGAILASCGWIIKYLLDSRKTLINGLVSKQDELLEAQTEQSKALAVLVARIEPQDREIRELTKRTNTLSEATAVLAEVSERHEKYWTATHKL